MKFVLKTGQWLKPAAALALIALVLLLSVAGSSTALHKLIHEDASDASHSCVVTLFAKGQISSTVPVPVLGTFFSLIGENCTVDTDVFIAVSDIQLQPGRAPPLA